MIIDAIRNELLLEIEKVIFENTDSTFYYFRLEDEYFTGIARVERSEGNIFAVDYKEDGQEYYRGNGVLTLTSEC